jgi:hypothetical protein
LRYIKAVAIVISAVFIPLEVIDGFSMRFKSIPSA